MSTPVIIADLNKADVLAALFNATNPGGMGFLQASNGPTVMDRAHAEKLLSGGQDATGDYPVGFAALHSSRIYFDYVYGRCLKTDLSSNTDFDPWGFDRDNGGDGAAQRVIDHLRATGSTERADGKSFMDQTLNEDDAMMYLLGLLNSGR